MTTVRTRFAPSPTGFLHIGGARTALFSWLHARRHGGRFVLRVEDTDRERSTPESVAAILEGLEWLGIDWDEGPFFQSERDDLYREKIATLLDAGKAYRCWLDADDLDGLRKEANAAGRRPDYEAAGKAKGGDPSEPHVIRFRMPADGQTQWVDLVKGGLAFDNAELEDLVIARSDGTATYNFVVVVDDAEMGITQVIRGEDHVNNTPKQIQLYRALGYDVPEFAHMPLILGLDRSRLSKRHGATSVTAYRDLGFLADGLVNYLARLGWSHGDDELFTRDELLAAFRLEDVGTSAGVFNPEKLEWVNAEHIKKTPAAELVAALRPLMAAAGRPECDDAWLQKLVEAYRERVKTLVEILEVTSWAFDDEIEVDEKAAAKNWKAAAAEPLADLIARLEASEAWSVDSIRAAFEAVVEAREMKLGKLAQPVRVAVTGGTISPGIFETLELVGRERGLRRLRHAAAATAAKAAE